METCSLTIAAPHGLHIRTAARIVELVRRSEAKVRLFGRDNQQADGGSLIAWMILFAERSRSGGVKVEVEGRNRQAVAAGLAEILGERVIA